MISFDEAAALVAGIARPLGVEPVALAEARGRNLAAPVLATRASPSVEVSAMDGYAVREADLVELPARLPVVGAAFAGTGFSGAFPEGACVRIFTGAPVPAGADRVIIQEDVTREGDVAVFVQPPCGRRNLRAAGSDFQPGDLLVPGGSRLNAQRLVAAAAANLAVLEVFRRPRIAILATGDELFAPGTLDAPADGIPESVSFGVGALAEAWGAVVASRQRCGDEIEALRAAAARAVQDADLVVVTGGASVGERDFARDMFAPLGLELLFSKVAIRPGKPVWVGRAGGAVIVGLPGNPTSALVTARLFLAPLLAGLGGQDIGEACAWRPAMLDGSLPAADRETFHRARRIGDKVTVTSDQDSSAQRALAASDTLIRRRQGQPAASPGDVVEILDL